MPYQILIKALMLGIAGKNIKPDLFLQEAEDL